MAAALTQSDSDSESYLNFLLMDAARQGNVDEVRFWAHTLADWRIDANGTEAAMKIAAIFGQLEVVEMLMNEFGVSADVAMIAVASMTAVDNKCVATDLFGQADDMCLSLVTQRQVDITRVWMQKPRTTDKEQHHLVQVIDLAITNGNDAVVAVLTT